MHKGNIPVPYRTETLASNHPKNDLHKAFTSSKELPIPNGISECRSSLVSFIYA